MIEITLIVATFLAWAWMISKLTGTTDHHQSRKHDATGTQYKTPKGETWVELGNQEKRWEENAK